MSEWGLTRKEKIQAELDRQKRKNQTEEAKKKRDQKRSFWDRMRDGG